MQASQQLVIMTVSTAPVASVCCHLLPSLAETVITASEMTTLFAMVQSASETAFDAAVNSGSAPTGADSQLVNTPSEGRRCWVFVANIDKVWAVAKPAEHEGCSSALSDGELNTGSCKLVQNN